jgi:hypothetical protein
VDFFSPTQGRFARQISLLGLVDKRKIIYLPLS